MRKVIAMKCNKEQFEAIKPKLKGMRIGCISNFNEWNYLVNNEDGDLFVICNTGESGSKRYNREIHKTWNERIFLEACGIETEETFDITKDQILAFHNGYVPREEIEKWFPEVFKVKLEAGKWYKWNDNGTILLWNITEINEVNEEIKAYGFNNKKYYDNGICYTKKYFNEACKNLIEATEQEVFEALKNEAVKRGFVDNAWVNTIYNTKKKIGGKLYYYHDTNKVSSLNDSDGMKGCLFYKGQWATILETKTKEEAEKLLNCKII